MDLRVAGQDLFDQGRARARQAEDEDRPARFGAGAGEPREQVAIERPEQTVDEPLVVGRRVIAAGAIGLERERVGLAQAFGGPGVFALAVQRMGQGEQEPAARAFGELVVVQSLFESGQVGFGQLATQSVASRACGSAKAGCFSSAVRNDRSAAAMSPSSS